MVNLRDLGLSRCGLSCQDLEELRGLKHIRALRISGLNVGDSVVCLLTSLEGLEEVDLSKTKLTQVGLNALAASPIAKQLTRINISGTPAAIVAKMANFASFSSLRELVVGAIVPEVFDRIKEHMLIQSDVIRVELSSGPRVEIIRKNWQEVPTSARRLAPTQLVPLLEGVTKGLSIGSEINSTASFVPFSRRVQPTTVTGPQTAVVSPRRSPRLIKMKSAPLSPKPVASPLKLAVRGSVVAGSESSTAPLSVRNNTSPVVRAKSTKRSLLQAFGEEGVEPVAKRARRVSFAGYQPQRDDAAMGTKSFKSTCVHVSHTPAEIDGTVDQENASPPVESLAVAVEQQKSTTFFGLWQSSVNRLW